MENLNNTALRVNKVSVFYGERQALFDISMDIKPRNVIRRPDGAYVLGPIADRSGLWVATGCGAMGIAGSGAIGRWLARWITWGDAGDDVSALLPDRFGDRTRNRQWLERACRETFSNYYSLGRATYGISCSP